MISEMLLKMCKNCGKFFHKQAWEKELLQTQCCPFCGAKNGEKVLPSANNAGGVVFTLA